MPSVASTRKEIERRGREELEADRSVDKSRFFGTLRVRPIRCLVDGKVCYSYSVILEAPNTRSKQYFW